MTTRSKVSLIWSITRSLSHFIICYFIITLLTHFITSAIMSTVVLSVKFIVVSVSRRRNRNAAVKTENGSVAALLPPVCADDVNGGLRQLEQQIFPQTEMNLIFLHEQKSFFFKMYLCWEYRSSGQKVKTKLNDILNHGNILHTTSEWNTKIIILLQPFILNFWKNL